MAKDFKTIVNETSKKLLDYNDDWSTTFNSYADAVRESMDEKDYNEKGDEIKRAIKNMGITDEVQLYSSVSLTKKTSNRTAYYDLRFRGQHICRATVSNGEIRLHFSDKDQKNNELWFQIESEPNDTGTDINSQESKDFFEGLPKKGIGATNSPEHKLESLILRKMAERNTRIKVKGFRNMRPVMLGAGFFQMPTPLKGSTHEPIISIREYKSTKYETEGNKSATGGGIDILARVSHNGKKRRLAVIELKDENREEEPVEAAMTQGLIYATFLGHLLADDNSGEKWYNLFREQGNFKKLKGNIEILVIAMMPPKDDGTFDIIDETPIEFKVGGKNIKLIPCTCYVTPDKDFDTIVKTEGSYENYKKNN